VGQFDRGTGHFVQRPVAGISEVRGRPASTLLGAPDSSGEERAGVRPDPRATTVLCERARPHAPPVSTVASASRRSGRAGCVAHACAIVRPGGAAREAVGMRWRTSTSTRPTNRSGIWHVHWPSIIPISSRSFTKRGPSRRAILPRERSTRVNQSTTPILKTKQTGPWRML